jgi:CHAD domain-containing protein
VFEEYIIDRLKSIKHYLQSYQADKNPEHIQHLRVEIKKTKAILSFAKALDKQKYTADILDPLFRSAGKIREIKMNIHLLSALPHLPSDLISPFKKKEEILDRQFLKDIPRYIKKIKRYKVGLYVPTNLPGKKTIKKYFKKLQKKADQEFQKKNRDAMHLFRKKIKKMLYIYKFLPKKLRKQVDFDKKVIDEKQKHIGKWHDTYMAVGFLSNLVFVKDIDEDILKLKKKEGREFQGLLVGGVLDNETRM